MAANATMVPSWFGQPSLLGVYWTLEIEMLFYGLLLVLSWLRWLVRPGILTVGTLSLAALPRVLRAIDRTAGTHLALPPGHALAALSLAVMLWGVVFRLAYEETGGFRQRPQQWGSTLLAALGALALLDVPDPKLKWVVLGLRTAELPGQASLAGAIVIFILWAGWLRIDPPVLTYLGTISYSLYLFHVLVAVLIAMLGKALAWHLPLVTYFLAGAVLSVTSAAIVYRWVERPALTFSKRWTPWHDVET